MKSTSIDTPETIYDDSSIVLVRVGVYLCILEMNSYPYLFTQQHVYWMTIVQVSSIEEWTLKWNERLWIQSKWTTGYDYVI